MKITIEGARQAPSWESLERVVRSALCIDDSETGGRFTRIKRLDGSCDYRAPGIYVVHWEWIHAESPDRWQDMETVQVEIRR